MIKFLLLAGLFYAGLRFTMKTLFRPANPQENEVKGQRQDAAPSFDLNDVVDARYRDVVPDGGSDKDSDGDETTHV